MSDTFSGDILPATTGQNLGSASQRWNVYAQTIDGSVTNAIVPNPTADQTIVQPTGTNLLVNRFENIRYADQFAGADAGAKISAAIADLPATGGTIDARALEGAQTLSSFTVSKPTVLLLGAASYTLSAAATITVSANFSVEGSGWSTTTITSASGTAIFTVTASGQTYLAIKQMKLASGGGNAQALVLPATGITPGDVTLADLFVSGFQGANFAMSFGTSNTFVHVTRSQFSGNNGSLDFGAYDNFVIDANSWFTAWGSATNPQVRTKGGSSGMFTNCGFDQQAGGTTAPDIAFDANTSAGNESGFVQVIGNHFGTENLSTSKPRISTISTSGSDVYKDVLIEGNDFLGNNGGVVFSLNFRIDRWRITHNFFRLYSTIVDDVQANAAGDIGSSIFRDNVIVPITNQTVTLFTNGGRGFGTIEKNGPLSQAEFSNTVKPTETPELRNRIAWSESPFTAHWTLQAGASVTDAQTDPFGTSRAVLVTAGAFASSGINIAISNAGMTSAFILSLWAKSGSLSSVQVGIFDNTSSSFVCFPQLSLTATWTRYQIPCAGAVAGHSFQAYIFPGNSASTAGGTANVFGVQVADYVSDYIPTAGAATSDTTSGSRFDRSLSLGSKISSYQSIATVGAGISAEYATVDLTAQTAAVTTTTLYAVPSTGAGQYRVSWNAKVTTAAGVSSTLGPLTIVYTDPDGVAQTITCGAQTSAGAIATTSTTNTTAAVLLGLPMLLNCKASTNITYAFAYASNAANAMNYNLHIKLEAL